MPRRFASGLASTFDVQTSGRSGSFMQAAPPLLSALGKYQIRLAQTQAERDAACRLRFNVFNVELGEGLACSWQTGMDQDPFDLVCDHLIVEDRTRAEVVGTYRMQSGLGAANNCGYYSEQEFDFAPYEYIRSEVLELGRASIDRAHRTSEVLTLLWRGIAQYARFYRLRYLIGCSSLHVRDPQAGWAAYHQLTASLAPAGFFTRPAPGYALPAPLGALVHLHIPRLLRTYVAMGAKICSSPAWDREFGTMDFLTLLDLERLSPAARSRFLPDEEPSGRGDSSKSSEPLCAC